MYEPFVFIHWEDFAVGRKPIYEELEKSVISLVPETLSVLLYPIGFRYAASKKLTVAAYGDIF